MFRNHLWERIQLRLYFILHLECLFFKSTVISWLSKTYGPRTRKTYYIVFANFNIIKINISIYFIIKLIIFLFLNNLRFIKRLKVQVVFIHFSMRAQNVQPAFRIGFAVGKGVRLWWIIWERVTYLRNVCLFIPFINLSLHYLVNIVFHLYFTHHIYLL